MSGPDDYYEDGEEDMFSEQCTGCDQYVDRDSADGLCSDCRDERTGEE